MAYLSEIKKEIEFYKDFSSLVETLKNLALFQFHTAQRNLKTFDFFPEAIKDFLNMIDIANINHPFLQEPKKGVLGIIAVTSDEGFLGGLNNRVMNAAIDFSKERKISIIVVGKQGQKYTQGVNLPVVNFPDKEDNKKSSQAAQIEKYVLTEIANGNLSSVKIIYPRAFSLTSQRIEVLTLLPFAELFKKESMDTSRDYSKIILESSANDIIEYLAYLWVGQRIREIFDLSRVAEYAARYIHLEESTDKIKEDIKKLQLKYFKIRHSIIDQQMRELSTAKAILSK
ncbi:MAG: F0F1 ATP synthase subunit gamma [Candidatus Ratteibacteria bacterium]|nr:F0F1 ATP synthase subunit gamma [Candidatus Ratteibacteria bacterium]